MMSERQIAFVQLLDLCRHGDASAMAQLVREYEVEVRIVARARVSAALRPYLDSADLVQSVHRSILIGLREQRFDISTPENLVALALTIVRRKAARHWRRMRRQNRLSGHDDGTSALADLLVNRSAGSDDPHRVVANSEAIEHVLRSCDATDRALIELRVEGYSTIDAARRLSLNPDVARVRLSRLRKKLLQRGVAEDLI
jgi:RNA polymerase sigma-70 factor (ECF subfamily)